jgi:PAS domain S-box-containing protein
MHQQEAEPPADGSVDPAALLEALLSCSRDPIIVCSLDGTIRSWNPAAQHYTPAEAVGRTIELLIPPERLGDRAEFFSRLLAGETVHAQTIRGAQGRLAFPGLGESHTRARRRRSNNRDRRHHPRSDRLGCSTGRYPAAASSGAKRKSGCSGLSPAHATERSMAGSDASSPKTCCACRSR